MKARRTSAVPRLSLLGEQGADVSRELNYCSECRSELTKMNHRVSNHNNITGKFIAPTCHNGNQQLKSRNGGKSVQELVDYIQQQMKEYFFRLLVLHKLRGFDGYLVIIN